MSIVNNFYNNGALEFDQSPRVGDVPGSRYGGAARERLVVSSALPYWIKALLFSIGLLAFGVSVYLSWATLTSTKIAGCDGGQIFDCTHVMQSKWSMVFGVPVGIPAAALYVVLLSSLVYTTWTPTPARQRLGLGLLTMCSLVAAFAALWFIGLQLFVVKQWCLWCLAAHSCGLAIAGLLLWRLASARINATLPAAFAVIAFVALAAVQVMSKPPATYQLQNHAPNRPPAAIGGSTPGETNDGDVFAAPTFDNESPVGKKEAGDDTVFEAPGGSTSPGDSPLSLVPEPTTIRLVAQPFFSPLAALLVVQETQQQPQEKVADQRRLVHINGGQTKLDARQWPLVGDPDADQIFIEMFDYTCEHCRANHKVVKAARAQLGADKIAIIALSVPMDRACNSTVRATDHKHIEACALAKLAIAVWRVDAEKFTEFHDWLFAAETAPGMDAALAHAETVVDPAKLRQQLGEKITEQYVAKQVELYNNLGAGTIPKLLFPQTTVVGKIGSTESLIQIIKQQQVQK